MSTLWSIRVKREGNERMEMDEMSGVVMSRKCRLLSRGAIYRPRGKKEITERIEDSSYRVKPLQLRPNRTANRSFFPSRGLHLPPYPLSCVSTDIYLQPARTCHADLPSRSLGPCYYLGYLVFTVIEQPNGHRHLPLTDGTRLEDLNTASIRHEGLGA